MKIGSGVVAASLVLVAALAAPAVASAGTGGEVGYTLGSLAVADLNGGQLARAEQVLAPQSAVDARDPARMINMGIVYARSGRMVEARRTFLAVSGAPAENLILSDGREISSHLVAREQLALLDRSAVASR